MEAEFIQLSKQLKHKKYIVGLDLSVRSTGWCIENTKTGSIRTGTIGTKIGLKEKILDRERFLKPYDTFDKIRKWIVANGLKNKNSFFVIEDFIGGGNGSRSVVDMAELGGLVKGYLQDEEILFFLVSPGTWKKFIYKGNMKKPKNKSELYEVAVHIKAKYDNIEFETTDETDAFALVKFIKVVLGFEQPLDKKQEMVVEKYRKEFLIGKPKKKKKKKNGSENGGIIRRKNS